jgi:hypothetical protein
MQNIPEGSTVVVEPGIVHISDLLDGESHNIKLNPGVSFAERISAFLTGDVLIEGSSELLCSGKIFSYEVREDKTVLTLTSLLETIGEYKNSYLTIDNRSYMIVGNEYDKVVLLGNHNIPDYSEYKIYTVISYLNFGDVELFCDCASNNATLTFKNVIVSGSLSLKGLNFNCMNVFLSLDQLSVKKTNWIGSMVSHNSSSLTVKKSKLDWRKVFLDSGGGSLKVVSSTGTIIGVTGKGKNTLSFSSLSSFEVKNVSDIKLSASDLSSICVKNLATVSLESLRGSKIVLLRKNALSSPLPQSYHDHSSHIIQ